MSLQHSISFLVICNLLLIVVVLFRVDLDDKPGTSLDAALLHRILWIALDLVLQHVTIVVLVLDNMIQTRSGGGVSKRRRGMLENNPLIHVYPKVLTRASKHLLD